MSHSFARRLVSYVLKLAIAVNSFPLTLCKHWLSQLLQHNVRLKSATNVIKQSEFKAGILPFPWRNKAGLFIVLLATFYSASAYSDLGGDLGYFSKPDVAMGACAKALKEAAPTLNLGCHDFDYGCFHDYGNGVQIGGVGNFYFSSEIKKGKRETDFVILTILARYFSFLE